MDDLYSIGARMVANYPVGPIAEGGGLNMTVMSYLDSLDFGLLAWIRTSDRLALSLGFGRELWAAG